MKHFTSIMIIFLIPLVLSIGITPSLSFGIVPNSPRQQLETETALHEITCSPEKVLMMDVTGRPNCAWKESVAKLEKIGWETVIKKDTTIPKAPLEEVEEKTGEAALEADETEESMVDQTTLSSILKYIQEPPTIDPEKGYFVVEISDGLYWLNDFAYQVMFLTTGEGVIVVDAPPSMGENILNAIAEVTDEPVTHVIYSHIHKDHIGAAHLFPDTVTIIAHEDTASHLAMKNDPNRPIPTVTFEDTFTLSVGEQILELSYVGAFHSKGDILIYAPQQKVLMAVDIFHPNHAPFKNFAITKDIGNYISVHDKILNYELGAIISGHQQILGTPEDVKTNKEFTLDVLNNTLQGFQTWDFMEFGQQYGSEGMLTVFSKYIDAVKNTCIDLTLEKWEDSLDDVSVFVEGNCDSMFFYAFID